MAVFRIHKTENYTVMSNTHLQDPDLSLKAMGLMSKMLSLPDNWDYSIAGLTTLTKDGKASVMSALDELENGGYLRRTRVVNSKGQFEGYDYDIYENPYTEKPYSDFPNTEKPNTEKPYTGNRSQINTNKQNTKRRSTKKQSTEFVPPTLEEVKTYCKERKNNVDPKKFFDYFDASDWVDSKGNPVRNWKQKVITWESNQKPEEKPKQGFTYNDYTEEDWSL